MVLITSATARAASRSPAACACKAGAGGPRVAAFPSGSQQAAAAPRALRRAGRQADAAGAAGSRRRARLACRAASSSSSSLVTTEGESDYLALQGHKVYSAASGEAVELSSLWRAEPGTRCVVAFLTHFADLSSTELAQKLLPVLPELSGAGVGFLAVGLGEPEKARKFAELLNFPVDCLYADPTGDLYTALGFSPGFAPEVGISPYAKLLPMLAGIGSPGTIQEVLRGYVGDRSARPVFTSPNNLFDVLGSGYQRPLELATLRLFNMSTVLTNWSELAPAKESLLTQQGGCLAFDGRKTVFRHADAGILKYADVDALLAAALPAGAPTTPPDTQVLRTLL